MMKDLAKAIWLRIWVGMAVVLWLGAMSVAHGQPRNDRPDLTPRQADGLRDQRSWDNRPRWCRNYDRQDFWIERRGCGRDWECRARVNRKAERCGLR